MSELPFTLWMSELSPFALKLQSLLDYSQHPYRRLPMEGDRFEITKRLAQLEWKKRFKTILSYPECSPLDEYPLVPYLIDADEQFWFDSSAIAHWLDEAQINTTPILYPLEGELGYTAQLIDEAFDEFGLYMVHHMRWVDSASTNDAGKRLSNEFKSMLPFPLDRQFAKNFASRQVKRLPYLFSIAPEKYESALPARLTPPHIDGFPGTHCILENSWDRYLSAMEGVLFAQPYLLGNRFTVADASAYGQLSMNLTDPTTAKRIKKQAPTTFAWLNKIKEGLHVDSTGELYLSKALSPLLSVISETFTPLMEQNESAYEKYKDEGQTCFNEAAFNKGEALYTGMLLGMPFKTVVKTFQVKVWRQLKLKRQAIQQKPVNA